MRATQTTEARDERFKRQLIAWRAWVLLEGAWEDGGESVWLLAEHLELDYRLAVELRERGCPPDLAAEILL